MKVCVECCPDQQSDYGVSYNDGKYRVSIDAEWMKDYVEGVEPDSCSETEGCTAMIDAPRLCRKDCGKTVVLSFSRGGTFVFKKQEDGSWVQDPMVDPRVTLTTGSMRLSMADGTLWRFHGFDQAEYPEGGFDRVVFPDGRTLQAVYTEGAVDRIEGTRYDAGTPVTDCYQYVYVTDGENAGAVQSVTKRQQHDGGAWVEIGRKSYTYYGSGDASGRLGDVKTVTVEECRDGTWTETGFYYFRYYTADGPTGYAGARKFILRRTAYARLAADPEVTSVESASDAKVAEYADDYFEYDDTQRISRHAVHGGTHAYALAYVDQSNLPGYVPGYNHWEAKTVETRSDGTEKIIYTNYVGQVLLSELRDGDQRWIEYKRYDETLPKLVLHATPAAVTDYVDNGGTSGMDLEVTLQADRGLIYRYEYYGLGEDAASSIACELADQPHGEKKRDLIQQGVTGQPIVLRAYVYTAYTVAGVGPCDAADYLRGKTVYRLAKEIVYRDEAGQEPIETRYQYTWYPGTAQVLEQTTILPAVSAAQNGPGCAATRTDRFDPAGRLSWSRDERGTITYYAYDPVSGSRIQTIRDVDGSRLALPAGWNTPTGGGQHLVSDEEVDSQGRTVQLLGPAHEALVADDEAQTVRTAVWTVYKSVEETWTAGGYVIQSSASSSSSESLTPEAWLVNPVSISRTDPVAGTTDAIQAIRASTEGRLSASDSFPQTSWRRWTRTFTDAQGRTTATRVYHTIPTSGDGLAGVNYDETTYGYDSLGRQNRIQSPGGTITRTVYNSFGQTTAIYVGTDDTGATDADPTGGASGSNNLVLVTEYEYLLDAGCAECGGSSALLGTMTEHVDATTARVTSYRYDWRGRQESVISDEDAEGRVTYTQNTYDNLDRAITAERFWQSGNLTSSVGGEDLLLARTETFYDDRGQVYRTRAYAVDEQGQAGNFLEANVWYDTAGNPIKQQAAGTKAFTKTAYDGLGQVVRQYVGYDLDESTHAEAASVTDDTILEQTETVHNEAGSVLFLTAHRRMHNATGTGELHDPSGAQPKARTNYLAFWYDGLGRSIASAAYGTAGGTAPTRPATPPARSDEVLVTSTAYNDCGEAFVTIDPAGREDRQEFDHAGRVARTIQNYQDGVVDSQSPDEDVTVEQTYGPDGQLLTLTAKNPATGDQVTRYVYGTTLADSAIARNDVLRAEIYPDSDDTADPLGNGPDGVYDRVEYTYNRQGERTTKKDQNATVHAFDYDRLGRLIEDRVTVVGSGVDDAVRRIATRYTVRGQVETITSYDDPTVGTGTVLNEVRFVYSAFGQLIEDYQSHSGAVDMVTTPKVAYTYTDGSSGHIRPRQLVYPNGRLLRYEYNAGTDDALNRVSFLADDASGAVGTHLAEYAYLGTNQFVQVTYPEPNLRYDLAHGTGNDPYAGLDRFGRIVDLVWRDQTQGIDVERIQHGYDRSGNRLWRETPVAAANSVHLDEFYTYDAMNQLAALDRGDLNAARNGLVVSTKSFAENWALDTTGNWSHFQQDTDGNGTWDMDQSRTHNSSNELTQLAGSSAHVAHDRAGNMIRLPKPTDWDAHHDLVYDAWNRLVTVLDGEATVTAYSYDGRDFCTTKTSAETWRHYYYSRDWQILEEHMGNDAAAERQFVWGLRYLDNLVLRDRDTTEDDTLNERLYALQDANWNVVAISDTTGAIQECVAYAAYGAPRFFTGLFGSRASSLYDWETLYCGYRWDNLVEAFHVRRRVLFSHLGRWNRRDSIPITAWNMNAYCYVGNRPTRATDPSGLWGSDVHRGETFDLCIQAGYKTRAARTIADRDEGVDGGMIGWGTGWAPIIGDQSYHFNRNLNKAGGVDTRIRHKVEHILDAKNACRADDDPETAAKNLGLALHALQDFYAHGDYGITDSIPNGGNWIHHNKYSPQVPLPGKPKLAHYPDDRDLDAVGGPGGRPAGAAMRMITVVITGPDFTADYAIYTQGNQRIRDTRTATTTVLTDFQRFVKSLPKSRGCKCKKFFL